MNWGDRLGIAWAAFLTIAIVGFILVSLMGGLLFGSPSHSPHHTECSYEPGLTDCYEVDDP